MSPTRIKFALILLAGLFTAVVSLRATDLRGRVDGPNHVTHLQEPLPGITVALFATLPDGKFSIVRQTVTGPDGMYYFSGIGPGEYVLQIGGTNYPLRVTATTRQDIPTICQ